MVIPKEFYMPQVSREWAFILQTAFRYNEDDFVEKVLCEVSVYCNIRRMEVSTLVILMTCSLKQGLPISVTPSKCMCSREVIPVKLGTETKM